MSAHENNHGEMGVDSLRIGGMKVDHLPIAESAITKQQLPMFIKSDKENKVEAIKARYPTQTIGWIDGAIRECDVNLKNVRNLISDQNRMINEYSAQIGLCEHRDKLVARLDPEQDKEEIKELNIQFPPYNVKAMQQQIRQCREAIQRSNDVIDKEHESMQTLRELRVVCEKRDRELKAYGEHV